jgi:proteasome lid subunit RPN8/RPN11
VSDLCLRLSPDALDAVFAHAQHVYPFECCGALLGRDRRVRQALHLPNTTGEGPRRRFLIRPEDYRLAEAEALAAGLELVGFYHSHPDHPARPSDFDLEHAWPSLSYVIVSVCDGRTREVTSWRLREDRSAFDEELLGLDGGLARAAS